MKRPAKETPQNKASWSKPVLVLAALSLLIAVGYRTYKWTQATDAKVLFRDGMAALQANNLALTYLNIEMLHGIDPTPPQAYLLEGITLLKHKNLPGSVHILKQAADNPETRAVANLYIGEALYKNRQQLQAILALKEAIDADSTLTDAHRLLALAYYDLGASGPAIESLQNVANQSPDDPRPYRLMGIIHQAVESYSNAAGQYNQFLRKAPNHLDRPQVLSDLAECLLKAEDYRQLAATLPDCPMTPRVRVIAARLKLSEGKQSDALSLVDEALRLDSKHSEAHQIKASILLEQGSMEKAIQHLEAAVESQPYDDRIHDQLAQALARNGKDETAEKHVAEANRLRDLRKQFNQLRDRAAVDLQNAELRFELATVSQQLGMQQEAVYWLTAALAIVPSHKAAQGALREMTRSKTDNPVQRPSMQSLLME